VVGRPPSISTLYPDAVVEIRRKISTAIPDWKRRGRATGLWPALAQEGRRFVSPGPAPQRPARTHRVLLGPSVIMPVSEEDKEDIRKWLAEQDALPGVPGSILDMNGDAPLSEDELRVETFTEVLSADACRDVIAAAEAHGWTSGRHAAHPTVDVSAFQIAAIRDWLPAAVTESVVRPMQSTFGLSYALAIDDLFVAKYEPTGQPGLGAHEDSSEWSFVVVLNSEFEGGGTSFVSIPDKPVFSPAAGGAIGFNGQNRHEGLPVTAGVRYILAGFLMQEAGAPLLVESSDDDGPA
jgi:hypothetical protein